MANQKSLTEKVLQELTPGTLFQGFFLNGFDATDGRMWYFNFTDEKNNERELNSAVYYPTTIRYFKSPIERLDDMSLSFVGGSELGMIFEVKELKNMKENRVSQWFASRNGVKHKIFAVECFLIDSNCIGTFLIKVDEIRRMVSIV